MERIGFLEKKIKDQNEDREFDNQHFMEIIGKSKEIFKNLFDSKMKDCADSKASDRLETSVESAGDM